MAQHTSHNSTSYDNKAEWNGVKLPSKRITQKLVGQCIGYGLPRVKLRAKVYTPLKLIG
jgi:hypothetical protein